MPLTDLKVLLYRLLQDVRQEREIAEDLRVGLVQWELEDGDRARAFGIDAENVETAINRRIAVFRDVSQSVLDALPLQSQADAPFLPTLWRLWLPLALQLSDCRRDRDRPVVQGILGGQGTGKTTLAWALRLVLKCLGQTAVGISIDDIYKTHADRQRLKAEDPSFIRRGPPGTHDVDLGIEVLDRLRRGESPVSVPRFDKSAFAGDGDRTDPETVENVDIVLFEGWFVGVQPVPESAFDSAPPPIASDADKAFARHCNALLHDYLPLWERCDRLMVLAPVDYRLSQQWRLQAEREAIAAGKAGMSDDEVMEFVEYFWKALHPELFVTPLLQGGDSVSLVVEIEADHRVGRIY